MPGAACHAVAVSLVLVVCANVLGGVEAAGFVATGDPTCAASGLNAAILGGKFNSARGEYVRRHSSLVPLHLHPYSTVSVANAACHCHH